MYKPLISILSTGCLLLLLSTMSQAQQVLELKPNVETLPAYDISVVVDVLGRPQLRFSTMTWNSGEGALQLVAGETGSGQQNVYQTLFLTDGSSYDRLVGAFVWHPSHNHFHLEDYATYTLQPVGAPGNKARTSSKTSFCIMDTSKVDRSLPGAPKKAVYSDCGDTLQGMSVGWGDEYGSHLPGQNIELTDLADGDYELTIDADPKNRLLETNDGDNTSCVLLNISVTSLQVDVLNANSCDDPSDPPSGGEVVVNSIDPNTGSVGSLVPVTITGSGFADGMSVTFDNGSGPRPSATEVTVVDSNTINATITIKKGGKARDPVWDLRVGSGVLTDAFTVTP